MDEILYWIHVHVKSAQGDLQSVVSPRSRVYPMSEACSNIEWIRTLMAEFTFELNLHSKLFCDITVSNTWAESSDSMQRAKHIGLKYCFVKKLVYKEHIETH